MAPETRISLSISALGSALGWEVRLFGVLFLLDQWKKVIAYAILSGCLDVYILTLYRSPHTDPGFDQGSASSVFGPGDRFLKQPIEVWFVP